MEDAREIHVSHAGVLCYFNPVQINQSIYQSIGAFFGCIGYYMLLKLLLPGPTPYWISSLLFPDLHFAQSLQGQASFQSRSISPI